MTAAAPPAHPRPVPSVLDVARVREDFPILGTRVHGVPLAYFDNASTGQRPRKVMDAMRAFDATGNANVHRGVHTLSQQATEAFDGVREQSRRFFGARLTSEIVFTHGTTGGLNLVARSYGRATLRPGDEILLTQMEHHSNIVPWQLMREETGAVLKVVPVTPEGELDLDAFDRLLTDRTRIVSVTHMSNVLGTINPIRRIADKAHAAGAVLVVDGAQSAAHLPVNVTELGCDFFAASGHKMFGPTGVGILYGREALLERMAPVEGGGGMISRVTFERTTWAPVPARFEAGTPAISAVIGLGAAIDYLETLSLERIEATEHALLEYAVGRLAEVPGLRLIGSATERSSVISFMLGKVHPHDVGTVLDTHGVAIRAGHHCAQPLMDALGVPGTARASLAVYNTREEVDRMVVALHAVRGIFG